MHRIERALFASAQGGEQVNILESVQSYKTILGDVIRRIQEKRIKLVYRGPNARADGTRHQCYMQYRGDKSTHT